VTVRWGDLTGLPALESAVSISAADCGGRFRRGDANADGGSDLSDAVRVLQHLFGGAELGCLEAGDVDGSGAIDISDPLHLLAFLFREGPPPAEPHGRCDTRPGGPRLGCETPHCEALAPPDGEVWLARPDGCVQCEECRAPSLKELVGGLEAEGFTILGALEAFMPVCLACTVCPSGRFYLVLVPAGEAARLEARGWGRWRGEG
jgi:ferredoxin